MRESSSSPENSQALLSSGEGESVPADWLCPRYPTPTASLMALRGDGVLLLLFRRNLALPRQDLALFAAGQVTKLTMFLFQCFPSQATLLQCTVSAFIALGGQMLRMAA